MESGPEELEKLLELMVPDFTLAVWGTSLLLLIVLRRILDVLSLCSWM